MLNWQIALLVIGILVLVAAIVVPVLYATNVLPASTMFTITNITDVDTGDDLTQTFGKIVGTYTKLDEIPSLLSTKTGIATVWQLQSCSDDSCYYWALGEITAGSQSVKLYDSVGTLHFSGTNDSKSSSMGVILNTNTMYQANYGDIQITTI